MKVFISYSRDGESAVVQLVEDLKALGHDPWFDNELTGGHDWWDAILDEIRQSRLFVAAISPRSLASAACKRETAYAVNLGKPVLPVLASPNVSADVLSPELSKIQFVDYGSPGNRECALKLARALTTLPTPVPLPDPLPEPPAAPISRLTELRQQVESTSDLSFGDQSALLLELTQCLRDPEQTRGARTLLELFRLRRDLRVQVAEEVERVLRDVPEGVPPTPEREPGRSLPQAWWKRRTTLAAAAGAGVLVLLAYVSGLLPAGSRSGNSTNPIDSTLLTTSASLSSVPTSVATSSIVPEPPPPPREPTAEEKQEAAVEYNKAVAAVKGSSYQEAENYLTKALKLYPNYLQALRLSCDVGVELERPAAASFCERAIALKDDEPRMQVKFFYAQRKSGSTVACEPIARALQINPKYGEAYYVAGLCHQSSDDWSGALRNFKDAYRYMPTHWRAHYGAALALFKLRRFKEGDAEATSTIKLNPQSAHAYYLRGIIRWQMTFKDSAKRDFQQAVNLAPGDYTFSRFSTERLDNNDVDPAEEPPK